MKENPTPRRTGGMNGATGSGETRDAATQTLLTAEQQALRVAARQYLANEVAPIIDDCERDGRVPREVLSGLASFGYLGGFLPEVAGGMGLSYLDLVVLMEQAGYQWMSLRSTLSVNNMIASALAQAGSRAQQDRYLKPLLAGQAVCFFGLTEPNHGSDVRVLDVTATEAPDGRYRINGTKLWITNGAVGDFGIVLARVRTPAGSDGGPTAFLIDPAECRYEARRVETMFIKATTTSELVFSDAEVSADAVLGEPGTGRDLFAASLILGRLNVAAGAVGAAQRALDEATRYARERTQFGRPIGKFQLIQAMVADMRVQTTAARCLTYTAARAVDNGADARTETAMAKLFATETAFAVADKALQVHGGIGLSTESTIERLFRDARGALIVEGTSEIQRLLIAKDQLRMSALV
jgi:alkylation response protein AidB-like acyl-CoA dehydrogenase